MWQSNDCFWNFFRCYFKSTAIHNEEVENTQIAHIFMIEALQIDWKEEFFFYIFVAVLAEKAIDQSFVVLNLRIISSLDIRK